MRRAVLVAAALLLSAGPLSGALPLATAAATEPVRISLNTSDALIADPGTILTLGLRVEGAAETGELIEEFELPDGWSTLLPPGAFTASPMGVPRLIALQIPSRTPAGSYDIQYRLLRDEGGPSVESFVIPVEVAGHRKLLLLASELSTVVIAGQSLKTSIFVRNLGNVPLDFRLTADPRLEGYTSHLVPDRLQLLPGASIPIGLQVDTSPKELVAQTLNVTIQARAVGQSDGPPLASVIVSTAVLPIRSAADSLTLTIPAKWTVRALGEDGEMTLQTEVRGSGPLTEAGDTELEFLLQLPDTLHDSPYGERDEYFLRYTAPDFTLRAGDSIYTLSPLTSRSVRGRGGSVEWHPDDEDSTTTVGGFYAEGRSRSPDKSTALYLREEVAPDVDLQLNLTSIDEGGHEAGTTARLVSLQAKGRPDEHVRFDTEYARGERSGDGDSWQEAYRADIRGKWDRSEISLQTSHADPEYPGPFSDVSYTRLAGTLPFSETSSFTASYGTYAQNLDRSLDQSSALREKRIKGAVKFELPEDWYLALGYETLDRHDAMPPANFDTREEVGTFRLGQNLSELTWNVELRAGLFADEMANTEEEGSHVRFNLGWNPGELQHYQLYGGFTDTEGSSLLSAGGNFLGATMSRSVSPNWTLRLGYLGYNFNSDHPRRDEAHFASDYNLDNGSVWSVAARLEDAAGRENTVPFMVSYTMPFDVPVGTRKSVGTVEGRIIDVTDPARKGIPEVILTLGAVAAVTDEDGHFRFPPLTPGDYHLDIDLTSLGLAQITAEALPLPVHIDGGKTTMVELSVTPASALRGTLQLIKPGTATEQAEGTLFALEQMQGPPPTLGNIYLELTQGDQIIRRVTNEDGSFAFERLRPGIWHLQVYDTHLPSGYQLAKSTFEVTLGEGEQLDLTIELQPRRREIKMVPSN